MNAIAICTVDGCSGKTVARGYCRKHYGRWHRNGNVDATMQFLTGDPRAAGIVNDTLRAYRVSPVVHHLIASL